jgi:hypothetical protein
VSLTDRVAELRRLVEDARAMPMSASVVVNRGDLTAALDRLEAEAETTLRDVRQVESDRDEVVAGGRREAEELLAEARSDQERLASESEVLQAARATADAELTAAREEAESLRRETDDYVDGRLAELEVTLERTLDAVRRGRRRLADRLGPHHSPLTGTEDEVKLPRHLGG